MGGTKPSILMERGNMSIITEINLLCLPTKACLFLDFVRGYEMNKHLIYLFNIFVCVLRKFTFLNKILFIGTLNSIQQHEISNTLYNTLYNL